MIEIPIPKTIKIGGFDYKIEMNAETSKRLQADGAWGKHSGQLREIMLGTDYPNQQLTSSFMHEILHSISDVYLAQREVGEEQVSALANGLLQVFEQLGIRFVKK